MNNIWVTADQHFHHKNIIKYCNRPFLSAEEMNNFMIKQWNKRVKNGDVVYHLGDFALARAERVQILLTKVLRGYKILITGNHDKSPARMKSLGFDEAYKEPIMYQDKMMLCHWPRYELGKTTRNIGVDQTNFAPILMPQVDENVILCGHVHENWAVRGPFYTNEELQALKKYKLER
jgi:calcineurin-like phosphoesterase family protein